MRAVRVGIVVAVSAALFAIPAYAVVNFQTGGGKDGKLIHLTGDDGDDDDGGVSFVQAGSGASESNIPTPSSGKKKKHKGESGVPNPGSDSSIPTPGSGKKGGHKGGESSIPSPGSESNIPAPGSGPKKHHHKGGDSSIVTFPSGCLVMCGPSDSGIHLPGSGSSSLPGDGDPLGVPESSTWMMMMLGFFSIGAIRYRALRRARKVDAPQQQDQA